MGMGPALEAAVELGPVVAEKELMDSAVSSEMVVTKSEAVHWN
jgi:hypothetical protein